MAAAGEGGAWHPERELDGEHAHRKVWLVKVPNFVAKRWQAICEQSMDHSGELVGPKLATMRHITGRDAFGAPQNKFELHLDNPDTQAIPQQFSMKNATANSDPMLALSDCGGCIAAEGLVHQRFECEVLHRGGSGGPSGSVAALDPAYRAMSRERFAAAAQRTRTVQHLKDTRMVGVSQTVQIGQKRKQTDDKRVANMTPEQLTAALFRLFERQARWSFPQLQKETAQPSAPLKTTLLEISFKNARGPYKDLWELKKEYRTGERMEEPPP